MVSKTLKVGGVTVVVKREGGIAELTVDQSTSDGTFTYYNVWGLVLDLGALKLFVVEYTNVKMEKTEVRFEEEPYNVEALKDLAWQEFLRLTDSKGLEFTEGDLNEIEALFDAVV